MKYHQGLSDVSLTSTPSVFILGTFDGLHLGHQFLLKQGRTLANDLGIPLSVMTVSYKNPCLITPHHKCRLFESLDVDLLIDVPFTKSLKNISADAFVSLLQQMVPVHTWVGGTDLRFGRGREGSCAYLSNRTDMKTHFVERLSIGGEGVSSTRIRRLVSAGELSEASSLLGRPYSLLAPAMPLLSDQNSYSLDFSRLCLPPAGEYDATVSVEGCPQTYASFLHIGETCFVRLDNYIPQPAILEVVL